MKRRDIFKIAITTAAAAITLPAAANLRKPATPTPHAPAPTTHPAEAERNRYNEFIQLATQNPQHTTESIFTTNEAIELMRNCFYVSTIKEPYKLFFLDIHGNLSKVKHHKNGQITIEGGLLTTTNSDHKHSMQILEDIKVFKTQDAIFQIRGRITPDKRTIHNSPPAKTNTIPDPKTRGTV